MKHFHFSALIYSRLAHYLVLAFNQITQNNTEYGLKKLNVIKEINLQLKFRPSAASVASKVNWRSMMAVRRRDGPASRSLMARASQEITPAKILSREPSKDCKHESTEYS